MNKRINFRVVLIVSIWALIFVMLISFAFGSDARQSRSVCDACKKPVPQAVCVETFGNVYFSELAGLLNSRIDDVGKFGYWLEQQGDGTYRIIFVRDSPCAEQNLSERLRNADK